METSKLRKFASFARKSLIEQVSTKMKAVLSDGSLARRENAKAVTELEGKIAELGEGQTIEMVAYTWFNRFCALRYMDVNRYTKTGILSPAEGQFLPEILGEAKAGHIDEEIVPAATRKKVLRILDGTDPSDDPQGEAYRLLLVAACNHYHSLMPFLFAKISDYTELLLPDDLLSGSAIPTYTREALLPANCSPEHTEETVEVIGWLYQFYIADKKDDVFAALRKGKKITPENIPAATQLFTPHWIVRYLVENSLGRLWMLNDPDSKIAERMDYYIQPDEPETEYAKVASPEEIRVCDPACGSGHMLTYAFDLLYAIYEEQGYNPTEIPRLILAHNLFGIEIDERAGALAAFALTMKAREKDRRFFSRKPIAETTSSPTQSTRSQIQNPNICVLEKIEFDPDELGDYMDKVGRDLFTGGLQGTLNQWKEACNFGSLIRPLVTDVSDVLETLRVSKVGDELLLRPTHAKVLKALQQADYLSPKYHVVVANPPYMGSKGMNGKLVTFAKSQYPDSRHDAFSMFIERNLELATRNGHAALITMQAWMFYSSYEKLRNHIVQDAVISSMLHLGPRAFDSIGGEVVTTTSFVLQSTKDEDFRGAYFRLVEEDNEEAKRSSFLNTKNQPYYASAANFQRIPGSPIAYWVNEKTRIAFESFENLGSMADVKQGLITGDNDTFLRLWFEVELQNTGFECDGRDSAIASEKKWFPLQKGGGFRKWSGNHEYVVNWLDDGYSIRNFFDANGKLRSRPQSMDYYFKSGITWTSISNSDFNCRLSEASFIYSDTGPVLCPHNGKATKGIAALLNSKPASYLLQLLAPGIHYNQGPLSLLPVPRLVIDELSRFTREVDILVGHSKEDWDRTELSWRFHRCELLSPRAESLPDAYSECRENWAAATKDVENIETQHNEAFISAFGLEDELEPFVERCDVSLDFNPYHRYDSDKSESELEALLLADTMREFVSYAVGCMLGRYSLDKPGLILANQGDTLDEYLAQVPEPSFMPDDDNVIPMLDGHWFTDDISERFKEFLKVTFGTEHYAENLKFLEDAIYPDNATTRKRKTIHDYFLKDFYNHHWRMYKKRPIYWLFSSPKGTFNALVYMHRYRPDTVSTVLQYLRDFRDKLAHRRDHQQMVADSGGSTKSEQTKALKEATAIKKQLKELEEYERDTLFPLAQKKQPIDLDDGVKHNYPLFGKALKKIPGLSGK